MDKNEIHSSSNNTRDWRALLGEIKTSDDLLTRQGQELYALRSESLPPEVQRWRAAFGLCLWLGNGWSDICWQHLSDLFLGVEGFAECGFELGYHSGQEVLKVFRVHGLEPGSTSFEKDFHKLPESVSSSLEAEIAAIDERVISEIWEKLDVLNEFLIRRAAQLAKSTG